ncbi:hypothetical protein HDU97_000042 [Phlyctochytrium planicorne]|nr:hypothetical protein HDU97_000042 [Phlyctochytrium planicorne]
MAARKVVDDITATTSLHSSSKIKKSSHELLGKRADVSTVTSLVKKSNILKDSKKVEPLVEDQDLGKAIPKYEEKSYGKKDSEIRLQEVNQECGKILEEWDTLCKRMNGFNDDMMRVTNAIKSSLGIGLMTIKNPTAEVPVAAEHVEMVKAIQSDLVLSQQSNPIVDITDLKVATEPTNAQKKPSKTPVTKSAEIVASPREKAKENTQPPINALGLGETTMGSDDFKDDIMNIMSNFGF